MMMVSPERIMEYANIPAEGSEKVLVIEPPQQWPHNGSIQFDNVVFSYKDGAPAVLKGLSFDIQSNEKIGIVGRTGAGKSSLTMALFRINELDAGRILIDGEDISSMPLRSLRSRLSIIPQAPVLFKGTLRAYMDPFDEYTDGEIWSAFEKVEMKEQIGALEHQLSYELSENGENFSVGERQMLCMARALLTQTRIVVMDEATASIDHATERKLQKMITRDFQDATVLTIAHRLATVLDSDRIMVLSDGEVVEFDTPKNLVANPRGVFYELAKEGGYLDQLL
jgi:ABC-type multidrug transport system fused ATPase/permease subunit